MSDWNKANDNSIHDMIIDIVITIKAHIAQQEREKTISRINAKVAGKTLGRPKAELPRDFVKEYIKFKEGQYGSITSSGFAKMLVVGRSTLYKYINIYEINLERDSR